MSARRREIELLLLAMFAAIPLYATQTIAMPPLLVFHALMAAMVVRVAAGRSPEIIPSTIMRGLAMAYIVFYVVDAAAISRNAIAASTHLILFIAVYQPIESLRRRNDAQRLLTASLICVASVATATHISIVPFIIAFGFMLFRQLMAISHAESASLAMWDGFSTRPDGLRARPTLEAPPSGRAAAFYVSSATDIAVVIFPMLPRVRNTLVPGMVWHLRLDVSNYDVRLASTIVPLRLRLVAPTNYPVTPPVAAMARRIVGNATDPMTKAAAIEHYLSTRFRYIPNPADIGHPMTVDDFLLKEQRGHCEYFAAGMVALLTAVDVPARIVGGFYGGKLNPLTGYFIVRREDAHAWVEVFDGGSWQTFDPTPVGLRPGNAQTGLVGAYASAIGDSINYFWDRYILTFGLGDQVALALQAIGGANQLFAFL